MPRENAELARRWIDAINRRDPEVIDRLIQRDYELHNPWTPGGGVHRGRDSVRSFARGFFDSWETFTVEEVRLIEAGESVVVLAHARAEGKTSGLTLDGPLAYVHTVREGRLARTQVFMDHREALRAAGLGKGVEVVLSGYEAAERGEWAFGMLDEDIVWDMTRLGMPDLARVYRGHDGIREFWQDWLAAWETIEFRALAVESHGHHVIVEVEQRNRGRGSGVAVDFHYFQGFTVRDGRVTASWMAETRAKALEAARD
jgi:ketosteroid isomerase-like protein